MFKKMDGIVALRIYRGVVGILGIIGNGLVCFVIGKVRTMHTRANAFIFHQAVVDFLGSVLIFLDSETHVPPVLPDNELGWFLCTAWSSKTLSFIVFITSTYSLLAVTMERYHAIVHPFDYQGTFSRHPRLKVGLAAASCWFAAIAVESFAFSLSEVRYGNCVSKPGARLFGVIIFVTVYLCPAALMLFAYIRTNVELRRGAASLRVHAGSGQATVMMTESLLNARRNNFRTLLIVFVTFVICWTPDEVIFLMFNLGYPLKFTEWYYLVAVALVATNSCVNPVIYTLNYRQFRQGLRRVFCCKAARCCPDGQGNIPGSESLVPQEELQAPTPEGEIL